MYEKFVFHFLSFCLKCPLFQFFSRPICKHHSYPNRGSKRSDYWLQNYHILPKNVIFKPNFWDKGHFYANFLFYIISFCLKCLLLQSFFIGKRMHIPILTGVQKGHNSGQENDHILLKTGFWRLISKVKVNCTPIATFIFSLFNVNPFSFSLLVMAYIWTFSS